MFRKMYQGGSSRKQPPRLVIRELDLEPRREALVRPCEWPSDEFMIQAGFKDEFYEYVCSAYLEDFVADKCRQYYHLTDSFVWGGLTLHLSATLTLLYFTSMLNRTPWTLKILTLLENPKVGQL